MQSPAPHASEPPMPPGSPGGPANGAIELPRGLPLSRTTAALLSIGVLAVVGIGDYLTDWYFLFDAFYLVPLALVTVYAGRRAGTYMALACSVVWLVSLYPQRASLLAGAPSPSPLIWVWNFAGRFALQTAFAWILASLREEIAAQRRLVTELHAALDQVARLQELLPICAWCKKIRDDTGYWKQLDLFMQEHDYAKFTHGICPDCEAKLKAEYKRIKTE
jgi:hypothetical protein